jgi:ankyrin repeat protein
MTRQAQPASTEASTRPIVSHAAGAQALARTAAAGDLHGVASLLAAGVFADAPLPNGETALMRAAACGLEDVARLLLDAGANASARRADGFTPLTLAAFFGHTEVVRLLLERGAEISARTRLGTTAAAWADARGFGEISTLLAAAAADPNYRAAADLRAANLAQPASRLFSDPQQEHLREAYTKQPNSEPPAVTAEAPLIQSGPTRQPVTGVLLAALAPESEAGRVEGVQTSEAELRARASEVTELFGAKPERSVDEAGESTGVAPADHDARDAVHASRQTGPTGGRRESELFASLHVAQSARGDWSVRSWQGRVGLLLLALACVMAVYAAWRATRPGTKPGQVLGPAQSAGAQPVAPLPVAQPAAPLPSPGTTPLDPQMLAAPGATAPGLFVPYPAGEPVAVPPVTAYPGAGSTSAPALVSEEGRQGGTATRRESTDAAQERRGATEPAGDENTRESASGGNDTRAAAPQPTGPSPTGVAQPMRPAPTTVEPAPAPTPGRKVIQWPPT